MESLSFFSNVSFIWEIGIPFVVALSVLVFVHELGHYAVARWNNVRVEVFSIGFGTELKGWTDRAGTRWKICAVPLGGYVKMFGESDAVTDELTKDPRPLTPEEIAVSFHHKTIRQRAAIVFAGPLVNYIFAVIAFAILFMAVGMPQTEPNAPLPAIVGTVAPNSAAQDAAHGDLAWNRADLRRHGPNPWLYPRRRRGNPVGRRGGGHPAYRSDVGPGGRAWDRQLHNLFGGALDKFRIDQSFPRTPARWGALGVLCGRGDSR
jgi:hypothetical protein